MRFFILALLFAFAGTLCFAQNDIVLQGYLGIAGGESFHYKLVFKDSLGAIHGYSYTWQDEKKQVKTAITGIFNKAERTLIFQETNIVANTGFESRATICLIKASLKYKDDAGSKMIAGAITTSDAGNVACTPGSISIPYTEAAAAVFNAPAPPAIIKEEKTAPAIRKPQKPVIIVYDTNTVRYAPKETKPEPVETITAGDDKQYEWNAATVELDIWDGGKEDGDVVSVEVNGAILLGKYKLVNSKKRLSIPIQKGETLTIAIVAHTEGSEPPNTAHILLTDEHRVHSVIANNGAGAKALIIVKRK